MGSHTVAKVVEIVGSSKESWAEAADTAVRIASKSIKNMGVQVVAMTAQVTDDRIETYKTTVKIAFGIED